jgi:hypothetical protein
MEKMESVLDDKLTLESEIAHLLNKFYSKHPEFIIEEVELKQKFIRDVRRKKYIPMDIRTNCKAVVHV